SIFSVHIIEFRSVFMRNKNLTLFLFVFEIIHNKNNEPASFITSAVCTLLLFTNSPSALIFGMEYTLHFYLVHRIPLSLHSVVRHRTTMPFHETYYLMLTHWKRTSRFGLISV